MSEWKKQGKYTEKGVLEYESQTAQGRPIVGELADISIIVGPTDLSAYKKAILNTSKKVGTAMDAEVIFAMRVKIQKMTSKSFTRVRLNVVRADLTGKCGYIPKKELSKGKEERIAVTMEEDGTLKNIKVANLEVIGPKDCTNCGKTCSSAKGVNMQKFKKCARCKHVFYCSRECQAFHWEDGHRQRCVPVK